MKTRNPQQKRLDEAYIQNEDPWHRFIVNRFKRHINRVAKRAIGVAFERGQIDSFTFHELAAIIDSMLFPPQESAKVVQRNNIVGGDMAARDINK